MSDASAVSAMRRRVLSGLSWTAGSQIVAQVLRSTVAIALARILSPEDYGIAAIAVVFSGLVLVFSDLALGAAVVQRPKLSEDDRCTAFWMAISAGVFFTIAGLAMAGPMAHFYGEPDVKPLCAALSASFLITSAATTHQALLLRDMQFGRLERCTMLAALVGAGAGMAVGLHTRDGWAIIAQQLTDATVLSVLLWRASTWRPRLRFSRASLADLGRFSAYLVGHRLLYYFHRNADNVLLGRYAGAAALGAYTIAYNVMLFPFSRIAGPVQKVLNPAFSRMHNEPERIGAAWVRVMRLVGSLSVPALMGMVVVAPDFVRIVLGSQWAPAAPLIQVLAWVGIVQSLQSINTDILQARGNTRTVFRFSILFTATHTLGFVVGLHWGVVGVAAAYAITTTLVEPVYTVLTARAIGMPVSRIVLAMRGVFEAGILMTACVLATREALLSLGLPAFGRLAGCMLVGAVVYSVAYLWRVPAGVADVKVLLAPVLRRLLGRRTALVPASERNV